MLCKKGGHSVELIILKIYLFVGSFFSLLLWSGDHGCLLLKLAAKWRHIVWYGVHATGSCHHFTSVLSLMTITVVTRVVRRQCAHVIGCKETEILGFALNIASGETLSVLDCITLSMMVVLLHV